jgi:exopolysaccharide biosynthesis polyprenyl glycosylphosphotransferase
MFAHQRKKIQLLFAIADVLLTIAAFEIAYLARIKLAIGTLFFFRPDIHLLLLGFCAVVWVAIGGFYRIYEFLYSSNLSLMLKNTMRQATLGTAAVVLFQYLLRLDVSRGFLLLFLICNLTLLAAFRRLSPRLLSRFQRGFGAAYHLVLVGSDRRTREFAELVRSNTPFRIEVAARLTEAECPAKLPDLLNRSIVDEVIFAVDSAALSQLESVFLACDEQGVRTRVAIDFFPHVNSEITLDRVGGAPLLTFSAAPLDDLRLVLKRAFDLAVSAFALLVLSPALALCALSIKLSAPGPVIFRQARCGLNGRRFTLFKFRSMVENAHDLRPEIAHLNEREVAFKIANDPRVTPVGRWLRKFSLDELPQLLNVLKGDMSIVGPRPPLPEEVEQYQPWQRRRLRMRPGLTCLWAIAGRDKIDFNAWMRLDISYIENWSLGLDWSIILKTIPHVIAGRGAH